MWNEFVIDNRNERCELGMPIRSKIIETDWLGPSELVLLNGVFHDTAVQGENERDREARAARIIGYYTAGVTDEAELRALAREPLGR